MRAIVGRVAPFALAMVASGHAFAQQATPQPAPAAAQQAAPQREVMVQVDAPAPSAPQAAPATQPQAQAQVAQTQPLALAPQGQPASQPPPVQGQEVPPPIEQWVRSYPTGQWVNTGEYGWIWVPAGAETAETEGVPYTYLYTPAYGWTWYVSPWGWGPYHYGVWVRHPWHPVGWRGGWVAHPTVFVHLGGHAGYYRSHGAFIHGGYVGGGHYGGGHYGGGHYGGGHSGGHGGGGHGHR